MAFTGVIVRQGNTDRFGVGAPGAFTRAVSPLGNKLYVFLGEGIVEITNLANGSGTSVVNYQNLPGGVDIGGAFEFGGSLFFSVRGAANQIRRFTNLTTGATTLVETLSVGVGAFATDGTTVWAYDTANNDLYRVNTSSGYSLTKVGDVTYEQGVTEAGVQGMFYWGGRLYIIGGHTDRLYKLPAFADNPTTWLARSVDSSVTSWGVTQGGVAGGTVFNGEAYMIGGNPDALYRFLNPPVLPDTIARLEFDEQTAARFDLSDTITDLESLSFQTGYTAPTYLTISGKELVVAANNPAIDADNDFDVLLVATRGADSVNFTQPMRARNLAPPPDLMPDFGSETISDIVATRGTAITSVTLPAATGGDGTLTYSLSPNLPTGMAFNATTRVLSGTPTATLSRTQFTYTVTDADGDTDTIQFHLTVNAPAPQPNRAPAFENTSYSFTDIAIAVGSVVGTVDATDADSDTLSYSLTGTDSGDFAIDVDGEITVAVALTHADSYSFNVVANDGTTTTSVPVTVTAAAAPPPPPPLQIRSVPRLSNAPMELEVELTPATALITWKAPTNGALLTGYEIRYAEGASPGTTWIPTESLSTRFFVKGLKRGTQYTWQVRGITENGAGDASSPVTERTPIASPHNALFFKECVNYFDDGARVSEHGNASNIIREVADNNYKTFTREKDLVLNIAVDGNPTRVDAIFVKGIDIEGHSAEPNGGTGSGYSNRRMPATVQNWEGTEVSTIVNGFQHDLYLLDQHFTATRVRMRFTGANAKIYEVMLLEFGISIDANSDFTQINSDFVDREGVIHSDPGGGIVYDSPIGADDRDKWEVDYVVRVVPGKTILQTPEDFLYWRSENRNHVHAMEPSRFPWRIFPSTFVRRRIPIRYGSDDKTGGQLINFRVAEQ